MQTIYIFLIFVIGIIVALGVGLEVSKDIDEFILYVLFWFLYIITIITFINIVLVGKYYLSLRNKTGMPGIKGVQGEQGDRGDPGKCDTGCRDNICENALTQTLKQTLKDKNNGIEVAINNIYIKSKIKQLCGSDEFKQLSPYNGPINLINYLKDIVKLWCGLLYDAGGALYFETLGAEDQFDWLSKNPFDEMKRYDVFYWGMGKQYRPQISNKCYNSNDGNNPIEGSSGSIIQVSKTNMYDAITNTNNSGAYNQASFWRPKKFTYKSAVFYPVGDIVMGPSRANDNVKISRYYGNITLKYGMLGPNRETILVSGDVEPPINYELLWTNSGWSTSSTSSNYFWVWRPIAPINYIALGDVITTSEEMPTTGDDAPIRCVSLELTVKLKTNRNVLWSSLGSPVDINLNMLGFIPNYGTYTYAAKENAYNLFRGVLGTETNIADSDVNGNFYYIDPLKYDANYIIGSNTENSNPDKSKESNRVGKGYINTIKKDSKYSVIAYLQLKNEPILKHTHTKSQFNGKLISNAISNSYSIMYNDNYINNNNNNNNNTLELIAQIDDDLLNLPEPEQAKGQEQKPQYIFSISFTGDKTNECQLKHQATNKILKFKDGILSLIPDTDLTDITYTLFIMS